MSTPNIPSTITQWCSANNYTEPHLVEGKWWAFADSAVMAVPLPDELDPVRLSAWASLPRAFEIFGVDPAQMPLSFTVSYLVPREHSSSGLPDPDVIQFFSRRYDVTDRSIARERARDIFREDLISPCRGVDSSPFRNISKLADLNKYIEKLRIDKRRKERDRRWRDDPLQLKSRCIDPVVEHFRVQTVWVLEWMLARAKRHSKRNVHRCGKPTIYARGSEQDGG